MSVDSSHFGQLADILNRGIGTSDGNVGDTATLEVECVDCRTWGTALVTTTGCTKDDSIIGDIISFFQNPVDTIISAFDMDVMISFENVGGHFDFDISASDTVSYSFPIFSSNTAVGVAVSEEVTFGFVLFIDLVFSLTAEIDLEAGFEFSFPDGAYITVDPLGGDIVDHGFNGGSVDHLPIICTSGSATFKAALRVRVQAGTTVELFGTGFDFELGVFADLIEYEATLATTPECELSITESIDCNIGAFAHAVLEIDYSTMGVSPAVVTTVLDVPLPSLCISRAADTGLSAMPTATTIIAATSSWAALPSATAVPSYTAGSSTSSAPGGIFLQGSSSTTPTASGASTLPTLNANGTITGAPSMTTSTVISTDLITITSCASTVLHCPASLASEIIITSTTVLYTTVCPVGQIQPSFTPTSAPTTASPVVITSSAIVSPIPLTPCATPVVSTVYTPTFQVPTYTMPTATSFSAPYPNWNATGYSTIPAGPTGSPVAVGASTITLAPTPSSAPSKPVSPPVNSTITASPKSSTPVTFTGAAIRSSGSTAALIAVIGAGLFVLL